MLSGLMLNALVTAANAGAMPVVGMPSSVHPASPMWRAASSNTRLSFLADQARLGLFSIGDLALLLGGILIITICLRRARKVQGSASWNLGRLGKV
jgi:hypothetical protein